MSLVGLHKLMTRRPAPRLDTSDDRTFSAWIRDGDGRTLSEFAEDGGLPPMPVPPSNRTERGRPLRQMERTELHPLFETAEEWIKAHPGYTYSNDGDE